MELDWYKCKGEIWCELNKLDITHRYIKGLIGVYIIWYEMPEKIIVKTGCGNISEELSKNKTDLAIQAFAKYKPKVTWAEVGKKEIEMVCAYINNFLKPKISQDNLDLSKTVEVNLPW